MANSTIYKGDKYYIEVFETKADLYSLNEAQYPSIKGINIKELDCVYRARTWVRIRGCEALYNGILDGYVLLDVRPSNDVEILEAKQVDRGIYHARLPVSEIESICEERMPFLDFPFPNGLNELEELDKNEFLEKI